MCVSNWCVTPSWQAENIPRGETAAVALTMDNSQLRLHHDALTACMPQVCKHTCVPPCACLRVEKCGSKVGCEVDICGCARGHVALFVWLWERACVWANLCSHAEHILAKLIMSFSRALQFTNSLYFSSCDPHISGRQEMLISSFER